MRKDKMRRSSNIEDWRSAQGLPYVPAPRLKTARQLEAGDPALHPDEPRELTLERGQAEHVRRLAGHEPALKRRSQRRSR
jgi:hypothetical protein